MNLPLCVVSGCCFRGPRFAEHLDLSGAGMLMVPGLLVVTPRQWDGSVPGSAKQGWKNTWKDSGDSHCSQVWSVTPGSQEGNGIGISDKSCGVFWGMQVVNTALPDLLGKHCGTLLPTKMRFSPFTLLVWSIPMTCPIPGGC